MLEVGTTFRLLGPLAVAVGDGELNAGGPRERTVLAMLLFEHDRVVSIDRLVDALWDESPPVSARAQVHICISALRRRFAGRGRSGLIETRRPGYLLHLADSWFDVDRFVQFASEGRDLTAASRPGEAARRFRAALDLWRGPPAANIESALVQRAAIGLAELRASVTEDWLESCLALGRYEDVARESAVLAAQQPLRERLRRLQVIALYLAGRAADALKTYRQAHRIFVAELGLEPSPQFQWLERAILTHDPVLRASATDTTRGRGPVLPAAPLVVPGAPRQLPIGICDFIGREELVDLMLVQFPPGGSECGAAVVTGPAGVGKTALAVRVAHLLTDAFPDGQLFVDLHGSDARPVSAGSVLERFLRALGVPGAVIPVNVEDRAALFRSLVADQRILIVLDDAATEAQVRHLLPGTGCCGVLVTSRRRLTGLAGARQIEVGLLDDQAALKMLVVFTGPDVWAEERAALRSLVRLCAGLPLALRIAAARLAARPHWSVADLVARLTHERFRLDELVHGGLGVRASISLSLEASGEGARRLFRRLGLLEMADFPAWVAAPLSGADPDVAQELLEQLVDARLVEVTAEPDCPPRYRMYELLRIYARERLVAEEPPAERMRALRRLLRCALHRADDAHRRHGAELPVLPDTPQRVPLAIGHVDQ